MKITLTDKALKALKPAPTGKRITMWDAALAQASAFVSPTAA